MAIRIFIALILCSAMCACTEKQPAKSPDSYYGTKITNHSRRGRQYIDKAGTEYAYRYFETVFTNDSTIPMHLDLALPKTFGEGIHHNEQAYRIFFLPESITPEKQFDSDFYATNVIPFIETQVEKPLTFHKIIPPGKTYSITTGYLSELRLRLEPMRMVVCSKGHPHNCPSIPDTAIQYAVSGEKTLRLFLGLDFCPGGGNTADCYAVYPIGVISF